MSKLTDARAQRLIAQTCIQRGRLVIVYSRQGPAAREGTQKKRKGSHLTASIAIFVQLDDLEDEGVHGLQGVVCGALLDGGVEVGRGRTRSCPKRKKKKESHLTASIATFARPGHHELTLSDAQ